MFASANVICAYGTLYVGFANVIYCFAMRYILVSLGCCGANTPKSLLDFSGTPTAPYSRSAPIYLKIVILNEAKRSCRISILMMRCFDTLTSFVARYSLTLYADLRYNMTFIYNRHPERAKGAVGVPRNIANIVGCWRRRISLYPCNSSPEP